MPKTMTALCLTDDGLRLRNDYPLPRPAPGEALVRVHKAGVCSTDLQLLAGYKEGYRGVLGHEFVGRVVEAPAGDDWLGCRVVSELNIGCGRCDLCRRGLAKHCRQRQSLGIIGRDGAFADYLRLPLANLHRVPDSLSDDQALFTEPLAAALQILTQIHISPASRVYLLGDGRLGQLVAQVLAATQADLTVIGRHASKLALLHEFSAVRVGDEDALEQLAASPADVVVEATGSPTGFATARRLVRPGGTIVLKSTFAGSLRNFDISSLVVDEVSVIGSRCGPFQPALRMLARGQAVVEPLIQARYRLADAVAALTHAGRRGVLKVVIEMEP